MECQFELRLSMCKRLNYQDLKRYAIVSGTHTSTLSKSLMERLNGVSKRGTITFSNFTLPLFFQENILMMTLTQMILKVKIKFVN